MIPGSENVRASRGASNCSRTSNRRLEALIILSDLKNANPNRRDRWGVYKRFSGALNPPPILRTSKRRALTLTGVDFSNENGRTTNVFG
ncbi:hypothetical protein AVEN_238143-1 [Araneus ventricosus]|uniref:Uncharacterized protein n=1 Tax=Araneus ventricosus TaxID=182803 RepID=A0A4Y2TEK5_ARAVE|nr:hypothetical protein AVEN_238143-1 [Araneus ventricosus]